MPDAFFIPDGDRFVPTELTRGPWDPNAQHAGPPAALMGRAVELCEPRWEGQVGRITFDIVRPVPIEPLTVSAQVVRPGRSVELLEASLASEDEEVMRATAWRIRTQMVDLPDLPREDPPRDRLRARRSPSSRPARTSATTRRWSTASSRAHSASWAQRSSGCG